MFALEEPELFVDDLQAFLIRSVKTPRQSSRVLAGLNVRAVTKLKPQVLSSLQVGNGWLVTRA